MIEFSIHQDYVFLAGAILLIIVLLKIIKHMSDKAVKEKKPGYGPVRIEDVKPKKVKEKTLFLEEKINQMLSSDHYITIKEYKKLESAAKGFRILSEQRQRAIRDCHAFIGELDRYLYVTFKDKISNDKEYTKLIDLIKRTNKT